MLQMDHDIVSNMYEWIDQAEGGCKVAQYNIGIAFKLGFPGWRKSKKKAFKWFHMAAMNGSLEAMCQLIECYTNAIGVSQNDVFANKWRIRLKNILETQE